MIPAGKPQPALVYVIAWLALLALLGLGIASAFLPLGVTMPAIQFGIAATQAAIVFILFMRLKGPASLTWIFAAAGFFWLALLFGLSLTDYATRTGFPAQP